MYLTTLVLSQAVLLLELVAPLVFVLQILILSVSAYQKKLCIPETSSYAKSPLVVGVSTNAPSKEIPLVASFCPEIESSSFSAQLAAKANMPAQNKIFFICIFFNFFI